MKPVLIKNLISDWPARKLWNFEYLFSKLKGRTVPVEVGKKYTDPDWGQELISFDNFLKSFKDEKDKKYLAQHPLLEQFKELEDDIIIPGIYS